MEYKYDTLYSDTDSVFFEMKSETYEKRQEEIKNLCNILNEKYDEFVQKYGKEDCEYLKIEPDKIFERWIQSGSKKRYAGILEWADVDMRDKDYEDKLEVKGFEIKRSNTSKLTTQLQKDVLKIILLGGKEEKVMNYLNKVYDKFHNGEFDLILGTEAVVKDMDEYKDPNSQAHVRAWKWANHNGYNIAVGEPFLWYWCDNKKTKAIPIFEENIPSSVDIDYQRMWERNVINKVKPIMNAVVTGEFNMHMFLDGKVQGSLEEFL